MASYINTCIYMYTVDVPDYYVQYGVDTRLKNTIFGITLATHGDTG